MFLINFLPKVIIWRLNGCDQFSLTWWIYSWYI